MGDGKPLEAWLPLPLVRLGLHPLTAARGLHVLAGMIGAVLIYQLARKITGCWAAFATGVLFALCPFVVYLQRLALSDILMCAAGIWVLLSAIQFIKRPDGHHAVSVAMSLVLEAFCKFPVGFFFLIATPMALLLMPSHERRELLRPPALRNLFAAHAPAVLLARRWLLRRLFVRVMAVRPDLACRILIGIGAGRATPTLPATIGIDRHQSSRANSARSCHGPSWSSGSIGLAARGVPQGDWRITVADSVIGLLPMLGIGFPCRILVSALFAVYFPPLSSRPY